MKKISSRRSLLILIGVPAGIALTSFILAQNAAHRGHGSVSVMPISEWGFGKSPDVMTGCTRSTSTSIITGYTYKLLALKLTLPKTAP